MKEMQCHLRKRDAKYKQRLKDFTIFGHFFRAKPKAGTDWAAIPANWCAGNIKILHYSQHHLHLHTPSRSACEFKFAVGIFLNI